jgi:hypothetical protein
MQPVCPYHTISSGHDWQEVPCPASKAELRDGINMCLDNTFLHAKFTASERDKNCHFAGYDKMFSGTQHTKRYSFVAKNGEVISL